jgi:hypothetical protein
MATTSKRYEYAAKVLQDVIDRKKKERAKEGLPLRHDIGYYSAAVANTFHDIDPRKLQSMVHEELLSEAKGKSVAFTFGRFNPPTIGHEKLINKVKSLPANDYKIYLSRSQDSKKNPLSPNQKLNVMKDMFPTHARNILLNPTNMVLDIATDLYNKGYSDVIMVVGSDRVREFENILNKYNDVKSRHGYYNFDKINVVSAGERDPDAEGTTGISASKMRDAAAKGDVETFKKGLPASYRNPADVERLMSNVRVGMGIKIKLAASYTGPDGPIISLKEFEQKQIRDLYVREVIFNINDKVNYVKEDIEGIIKRRGTNYIVLEDNNNNLHKAWIWDCVPVSADREVQLREHNLDVDYGFEAVSEIKEPEIKKKLTDSLKKKAFGALRKELNMKQDENESYEIGADYANHTKEMTPGEKPNTKPIDAKQRGSETVVTKEDIEKWQTTDETIDKYKKRYSEEWKSKLDEVVKRMMEKIYY